MCDYGLHHLKSRPANVGDKLTARQFSFGTTGFSAPEDINVAVCVLRARGHPQNRLLRRAHWTCANFLRN
jgi:hypothetical protein